MTAVKKEDLAKLHTQVVLFWAVLRTLPSRTGWTISSTSNRCRFLLPISRAQVMAD